MGRVRHDQDRLYNEVEQAQHDSQYKRCNKRLQMNTSENIRQSESDHGKK
jgi:hypothetical protein